MATHTMNGITIDRDEGMALSFVSVPGFPAQSFLTEDEAYDYAQKVHAAQLFEHFLNCIRTSRPQPTIKQQSTCRGYFPRVYRQRDYSHCRGHFPRVEMTRRALRHNEAAHNFLKAAERYFKELYWELSDNIIPERHAIWQYSHQLERAAQHYYFAITGENYSPPDQGGKEAADRKHAVHQRLAECTWVLGNNGTRKAGEVSGNHQGTSPHSAARNKLQLDVQNGDTVMYTTPPIPVDLYQREPREIIAWHIKKTLHDINYLGTWPNERKFDLPYGFKVKRSGYDTAKVYAMIPYKMKNGKVGQVGTDSVTVGVLTGKGWQVIPSHQFTQALDKIEKLMKKHKLTDPNPTPPRPRNPAAQRIVKDKAA